MIEALRKVIKRKHYPLEVMLTCVRWYAAYPLSLRHIDEMMRERGVCVDHATVHRWAMKILPVLAAAFPELAAHQVLRPARKACFRRPYPGAATILRRGIDPCAGKARETSMPGNNIVEQDHRAIKRIVRPMLGFKSFRSARILIAGIELMHMIKKGQLDCREGQVTPSASQFYSAAF